MSNCKKCGAQINGDKQYCPECTKEAHDIAYASLARAAGIISVILVLNVGMHNLNPALSLSLFLLTIAVAICGLILGIKYLNTSKKFHAVLGIVFSSITLGLIIVNIVYNIFSHAVR